ncbi:MAG: dephospho-CoA kinase [Terriglobales bacterium]
MLRLAITGGLCSGKSTVSVWLRERGCPVLDADHLAHRLLQSDAKAAVVARFGQAILDPAGAIVPERLAAIVFGADGAATADLNSILHPLVMEAARQAMQRYEQEGKAMAGLDAALLIECGLLAGFDHVVLVVADPELRISRFTARTGGSRAQALARMAHQWPDQRKKEFADVVVDNSGALAALHSQLDRLWDRLQQEAHA